MPGLVGLAGPNFKQLSHTVNSMASHLGLGVSTDTIETATANNAAMGADSRPVNLWGPRVCADRQNIIIGINGEIFGLFDNNGNADIDFPRGPESRPAEEILTLYKKSGLEFVPRLRGFFSLAIWDGPEQTLHLISDRFALRSLYYVKVMDGVIFASEVKAILASHYSHFLPDQHGISDFIFFGMPLGNRTFFTDIKLIPPASIVTFKKGTMTVNPYWQLHFLGNNGKYRNLDSAAKSFATAFEAAVSDCTAESDIFELPLSGGLDSRCVGAAIPGGTSLRSYTMGGYGSEDIKIGPQVASHLKIDNLLCPLTAKDFLDWIEPSVYLTDGMYSPINASIMPIIRVLPQESKVILDGANSFDGSYKVVELLLYSLSLKRYNPIKQAIKICPQPIIGPDGVPAGTVLKDSYIASCRSYIEKTLEEFLKSIPPDQADNPFDTIDYLEQSNRIRRFNMMGTTMLRAFYEVRQPFFDHRVVDIVTKLPHTLRSKEKLLLGKFLSQRNDYLASLPYERTGLPANANIALQVTEYGRRATKRVLSRIITPMKEKPRVSIDYMHWIKTDNNLQNYIKSILLDHSTMERNHIDKTKIESFLQDLFEGNASYLALTTRLISMELWYRFFIEGAEPPTFPPPK